MINLLIAVTGFVLGALFCMVVLSIVYRLIEDRVERQQVIARIRKTGKVVDLCKFRASMRGMKL